MLDDLFSRLFYNKHIDHKNKGTFMHPFLHGITIGFSIAAPVGVVGFLCIEQTLRYGIMIGIASGLGAATADMMYGILVACGLNITHGILSYIKTPFSILGGLFLCYAGLKKIIVKETSPTNTQTTSNNLVHAYSFTFLLTATNPATMLEFLALFTGLRINVANHYESFTFVGGVFLGSAVWWIILCSTISIFKKKVSDNTLQYINYSAGLVIILFGLYALIKAFC